LEKEMANKHVVRVRVGKKIKVEARGLLGTTSLLLALILLTFGIALRVFLAL